MGSEFFEIQSLLTELARRIETGRPLIPEIIIVSIAIAVLAKRVKEFLNILRAGKVNMTVAELSSVLYSLKSMGGGKSINFNWQRLKKTIPTPGQVCTW